MAAKTKKKTHARKRKEKIEPKIEQIVEQKAEQKVELEDGLAGLIKMLIIAATFVAIAALSIFAQGLDDKWPGPGIVAVRFALLSFFALLYFLMLYVTRLSRRNQAQKPQTGKK